VPALLVDPAAGHAYVASPDDVLADVDLSTLQVTYHDLTPAPSLLDRLRSTFDTAAGAKAVSGRSRTLQIVGDHLLALTGEDDSPGKTRGAGVRLIDTRDWSVRMLDKDAAEVWADGDVLVTSRFTLKHGARPPTTTLRSYAVDGHLLYERSLPNTLPNVWVLGPRIVLTSTDRKQPGLVVLNAADGRGRHVVQNVGYPEAVVP
jgi:hypothetical protein